MRRAGHGQAMHVLCLACLACGVGRFANGVIAGIVMQYAGGGQAAELPGWIAPDLGDAKMQPLTYLFDFEYTNDKSRPYVMQEFAHNGASSLVLTDTLIKQLEAESSMAGKLRQDLKDTGTVFVDSHAPFGIWEDLDLPMEEGRRTMIERKRLAMCIASDFGVDTITIHVGNAPREIIEMGYSVEQCDEAIARSLDELLPLAEKLGMVICIENIWCPTNTADKLLALIRRFDSEHLGICYDAGHANLMKCSRGVVESSPENFFRNFGIPVPYDDRILEKLLPHVVNCHLHDNNGIFDQHRIFGKGNVDWAHDIPLLKQAPRLRSFQSEVIPVQSGAGIKELVDKFTALMA